MTKIAPKFFKFLIDRNLIKSFWKLDSLQETDENIELILKFIEGVYCKPGLLEKVLIKDSSEAWQILGANLLTDAYIGDLVYTGRSPTRVTEIHSSPVKTKSKSMLLLNRMSDRDLSIDLLKPISGDHVFAGALLNFIGYQLPLETCGAFIELHGTTFPAYWMQLQYPYGLSSLLKNEYRLMYGANSVVYDADD